MKRYFVIFGIAYVIAIVAAGVLGELLKIGSSMNVATLLVAGFVTAAKFVRDNRRVPTRTEKQVLVWGSLGVSIVVSLLLLAVVVLLLGDSSVLRGIAAIPTTWILVALVFASAVSLLILYASYGWYARLCARKLEQVDA